MKKGLVSIIVLSYKNLEYIYETLDSIIDQNYMDIELIIGDDGTKSFDSDKYINYVSEKNTGNISKIEVYTNTNNIGTTRNINKAISLSRGEYIKLIAADDCLYGKDTISNMINFIEKSSELIMTSNMLFCDYNMEPIQEAETNLKLYRSNLINGVKCAEFFQILAVSPCVPAPAVLFKRELFNKYGMFSEEYKIMEDWPMWLRLSRSGCKIAYLDEITVKYRYGVGVSTPGIVNEIYNNDQMKCYEEEIFPFRNRLGYLIYKKAKWNYTKKYILNQSSLIKKILITFKFADIIFVNKVEKLIGAGVKDR